MSEDIETQSDDTPNFAAFMLTVGGVTLAFISVFVFAFPTPIYQYLTGIVIGVTVITLIFGMVLDLLGYFSDEARLATEDGDDESEPSPAYRNAQEAANKPLPQKINFDDEIGRLEDYFDGDTPPQMESFLTEYERLKSSPNTRDVVASNLRASLNPISVLVSDDDELESMVDEMGDRLFEYIKSDPVDSMNVTEYAFYDDGEIVSVTDVQEKKVRIKATVHNEGETGKAEVAVKFQRETSDGNTVPVKTARLPVGEVVTEEQKELNTNVYVPSVATNADVFVLRATQDTPVLDM